MRNIIARHAEKAYGVSSTTVEPHLGVILEEEKAAIQGNTTDEVRADICIQYYSNIHSYAYLDVRIVSTVCQTNKSQKACMPLRNAERRKKIAHQSRVQNVLGADFPPSFSVQA